MKIIYSIHFDTGVYLGDKQELLGVTHVGSMGLLSQLELRAGLSSTSKSDMEREAEYLNALKGCISGSVFEKAFAVDELGVARKLLSWRDALVMAGWDVIAFDGISEKLNVLAEAEKKFFCCGNADRWRKVLKVYKEITRLDQIHEIEVVCPWSEIPTLIQRTLERIEQLGVSVSRILNQTEPKIDLEKVRVVSFEQLLDAYEWFSTAELPKETVVVNRNNVLLNHVLYTWNKPMTTATLAQSNPQLLQLFKLCISIFSRPINIQNLTSYLLLPEGPIPAQLRRELAKLLLEEGGFGDLNNKGKDKWQSIIENYKFLNKENKETPQAKAKKMPFIEPIRKDYSNDIPKKDIIAYVDALKEWAQGHFADETMADSIKVQYTELKGQLAAFETALKSMGDLIQYKDIEKIVQRIYRPINYTVQKSEALSANIITDVRAIASKPNTLLWLDCQEADIETNAYDFLSYDEKCNLNKVGVCVPDHSEHLRTARIESISAMCQAGNIILVKSAYNGTSRLCEHPMIAEMDCLYKQNHEGTPMPITEKDSVFPQQEIKETTDEIEVFAPQAYVELGKVVWNGRQESNHSIDTLINYPFDYVTNYIAHLWEPKDNQLQDTHITQGLVAHPFFEHIVRDSEHSIAKMKELLDKEFDKRLNAALDATGLSLRLPENASLLSSFNKYLKESMAALIEIMENKNLVPVGCEMAFPEESKTLKLDVIGDFGARIDFLLTDKDGNYVIFDFKWSYSNTYAEKLEKNLSIQLELYRQTVKATYPSKEVSCVGYYLMPRKQLVTPDFDAIDGKKLIRHIDATSSNLKAQIQNSFKFRMEEICRGHIEEGEMLNMMPYQDGYIVQTASKALCPIGKEKTEGRGNNKKVVGIIKDSQRIFKPTKKIKFETGKEEPAEVATTHQILKGRLK